MSMLIRRPKRSITCCEGSALTKPAMYIEVVMRPSSFELGCPIAKDRSV